MRKKIDQLELFKHFKEKIKFKFSYVMQENTIVPQERNTVLQTNKWNQKISYGIIRRKMIDFLPVALVVNDKNQYAISFLDISVIFFIASIICLPRMALPSYCRLL